MPHYSHLLNKWLSFTLVFLEGLGKLFSHILADSKEINSVIPKRNQPGIFIGRTDAEVPMTTWRADSLEKTLMLGKIEEGGEGDDRGLDGWMASLTQWTWLWASSRRWWRTGKPGVLQSMGLQRVGHNWATEKQQILALFCTFSSWEISLYFKQWVLDLSKRFLLLIGVTTFSFLGSTLDFFGFYELSNFLAGCTSSFPQD